MTPDLSVLVCSVDTRYRTFALELQDQLWAQLDLLPRGHAEVLILTDGRGLSIGAKRNALARIARGRYLQFVDDDDRIAPDMFRTVLDATRHDADVITFHASVTLDGGPAKLCRYSLEFERDYDTPEEYRRLPNHICAVKRDHVLATGFPDVSVGEDADFAARLRPLLRTEHRIDRVLYHYDYCRETSESRR